MIDLNALLLDPIYDIWGKPVTLTVAGASAPVTVLDHRKGVQVKDALGKRTVRLPAGISEEDAVIFIRQSDRPATPVGGTVTFEDGGAYVIRTALEHGERGTGEWACTLQEA